ncbi:MAG: glycosyltransferase family 1 protein [Polyangiaceae bacterium]
MTTVLLDLTSLNTPSRNRGHGRYVRELALGLAELPASERAGLQFLALTELSLSGAHQVTEDIGGFEGAPGRPSPGPKEHYRWAYARRLGLARALRKTGAALVHLGDPNATPLFMGLSRCRKVVTCHDVIPARYPAVYFGVRDGGPHIGLAIERRRYQSADLVIAISDATERDALSLLRVSAERMVRVYNGVDVQRWQRAPTSNAEQVLEQHGLRNRPFVLYVGGLDWHKNIEGMLAGVARAKMEQPDLCLAWAGKLNQSQSETVQALVRKFDLGDTVKFLGFVSDEDLALLYRYARAHVLVSRCEGFGLTVVEAMAAGCPVLTTAGGSLEEVAGDAALTVEPDDHAEIGAALVRLFRDAALRARLIELGRARAPLFDRSVQARAMVSAYRRALSDP